jgi:hypothetical protein
MDLNLNTTLYSPQSGVVHIVHNSPSRSSIKSDEERKRLATQLIDTFKGNQEPYLRALIYDRYKEPTFADLRAKYLAPLPILKKLIKNISKIYDRTPIRKFYIDGKEIVRELNDIMDSSKYVVNPALLDILEQKFYNNRNDATLKMAEEYTNLLGDTIFKIKSDDEGNLKLIFLPNDIVSAFSYNIDSKEFKNSAQESNIADIICVYKDEISKDDIFYDKPTEVEKWTVEKKKVYNDKNPSDNEASKEAIKYFDSKGYLGYAFAPFVVFRSEHSWGSFWNIKDTDVLKFINELNLKLSHKNYLTQTDTDNTKVLIDGMFEDNAFSDPSVINTIKSTTAERINPTPENQAKIQELKTADLKKLDESIMQDMKTLFKMYDLPFDSLLATKNVMSAENKQVENEALFAYINSQMNIWAENEQNLFKTMIAVYNRDNQELPKGLTMMINFEKRDVQKKLAEEWLVEIQNGVANICQWIMAENPDLSKDEAQKLYESNLASNDKETNNLFEDEEENENIEENDQERP